MCLKEAFELSEVVKVGVDKLTLDLGKHNPGIINAETIDLQHLSLDAAIICAKLGQLRSMLCSCI